MGPRLLAYNDTGSLEHLKPKPEQPKQESQAQPTEQAVPTEASAVADAPIKPAIEAKPVESVSELVGSEAPVVPTNGVEEPVASA